MENVVCVITLEQLQRYVGQLHGVGEIPPPATQGACMECDRDYQSLWIVGDFALCLRCLLKRRSVAARLAAASPT